MTKWRHMPLGMVWKNFLLQNIPFFIFKNFNHDQLVVKIKFKGLKRQLRSQITEKLLIEVSKWRHMSDTGHGMHKKNFQNIPFIIFNNFDHDQLLVKTNFKGLKWQLSSQITEKWLSDVSKWRHMSDTRHGM